MNKIIEVLKGAVMGVANVIPGLSGGTIAVAIGIYEKIINAIAELLKHPIKVIKEIWHILLGILLGIVFSVLGVSYMLENYEVPSTMLFVGFILGSLPLIIKQVENKKIEDRDIIAFVVMLGIVILLPLLSMLGMKVGSSSMNPVLLLIVGFIAAATMIVPGISGSMVLMTLGYYNNIMSTISSCIVSLKDFNIPELFSNVLVLIPFGIGVILGIFLVAKVMKWLLNKYKNTTNWAILGLIVASPFAIITKINIRSSTIPELIISVLTFTIGYILAYLLCKLDDKKKEGK